MNMPNLHKRSFILIFLSMTMVLLASCSTTQITKTEMNNAERSEEILDINAPQNRATTVHWSKQSLALFSKAFAEISSNRKNAISGFEQAISLEPRMEAAYYNLLRLYYESPQSNTEETQALIKKLMADAFKENILSARMLTLEAHYLRNNGQFKAAEDSLLRAIILDPKHLSTLANMGILQDLYLHDLKTALNYYQLYQQQLSLQNKQDDRVVNWLADIRQRIKKSEG